LRCALGNLKSAPISLKHPKTNFVNSKVLRVLSLILNRCVVDYFASEIAVTY
jgi:hypothetical protein